ncbi:sensor histidine kinase [Saccharopolyspora erythraea]|uniref:sensor histidine kinase n=1 Tax=Saccharopolyspora erythraea TaxID=1836 RepID=UPI002012674F|nr:histidine kinase [Saccharopolyspora erythraea]
MRFLDHLRARLSWWDGRIRSLLFDLVAAVFTVRFGVDFDTALTVPNVCLMIGAALAFLLRRRFPWLPVVATAAMATFTGPAVAASVAVYTMARRRGPSTQLWIAAGLLTAVLILHTYYNQPPSNVYVFVISVAVAVGVAMLLGLWVFQRKMLLVTFRERAEQAERERDLLAERAVAAERRRIAREMHDVVAHRCSVISLQAGALTLTAPDERTGEVAEVIRKTSATALTELRSMLRVLREDENDGPGETSGELANDPTLSSIRRLVADSVESGENIRLDFPDQLPETSSEIGRAAYRVVQESLTNAAKHAPHAAVHVEVAADDGEVVVTVSNRRSPGTGSDAVPGSGYGLIGMRERVTLAGGALRTGWAEDGGYRVRAVFPLQ